MREAQRLQRAIFSILIIALFIGQWIFPAQIAYAVIDPVSAAGVPTRPADALANVATAEAQQATLVQTTLETAKSFAMHFKEFIGDSLATMVAKTVLRTITQSTVNWINSGFKGSPAFVTNPEGFLADITDQVVGQTIEELLPFVCSPFQLDIRIALGLNFSFNTQREIHCRLSDVIANVSGAYNAFVGGDFGAGGWSSWIAITGSPQNNPYGAYLSTVSAINARMVNAAGQEVKLLDWGKGFMSWRECEVPGNPYTPVNEDGAPRKDSAGNNLVRYGPCQKKGPIKTPGSVIESNLATALGADLNALGVADEINEVFAALVNQLIKQVFTSTGLAGASNYSGTVDTGQVQTSDVLVNSRQIGSELAERNTPTPQDFDDIVQKRYDTGEQTSLISDDINDRIDAGVGSYDFSSGSYAPAPRTGNIASSPPKYATQSSYETTASISYKPSYRAVDNVEDEGGSAYSQPYSSIITKSEQNPWWQVDLSQDKEKGNSYEINEITSISIVVTYGGVSNGDKVYLFISPNTFNPTDTLSQLSTDTAIYKYGPFSAPVGITTITAIPSGVIGPYVRIQREGTGHLTLGEVRVYGTHTLIPSVATTGTGATSATANDSLALNKKAVQSSTLSNNDAELAVDEGAASTIAQTQAEQNPWWQVDLSTKNDNNLYQIKQITRVNVFPSEFPLPQDLVADYAVFSKEPLRANEAAISSEVCAGSIIPGAYSYRILYNENDRVGTVSPTIPANGWWYLRIQRCNKTGTTEPLKLYHVKVQGKEEALISPKVPQLPASPLTIRTMVNNSMQDVTDGKIVLNNATDITYGKRFTITANERQTNLRFGVKLQTAIGGTSAFGNEFWSNVFQSFTVTSQSAIALIKSSGCAGGLSRCMNRDFTSAESFDWNLPAYPIIFQSNQTMQRGDTANITLTGNLPDNLANGSYKIILQIFKENKADAMPISSVIIGFTK